MTNAALARILPVLETVRSSSADLRPGLQIIAQKPEIPAIEQPVVAESESTESEVWEQGYQAGLAAAHEQIGQIAARREADLSAVLENARAQWVHDEARIIADGFSKAMAIIEDGICSSLEHILSKIVIDYSRDRLIQDFSCAVRDLLRNGDAGRIIIHAPEDFIARLAQFLPEIETIEFENSAGPEVWVRCNKTLIEARLSCILAPKEQG